MHRHRSATAQGKQTVIRAEILAIVARNGKIGCHRRQLLLQISLAGGHPRFDYGWRGDRYSIIRERRINRIHGGTHLRHIHGSAGDIPQSLPVKPSELWRGINHTHRTIRAIVTEQIIARRTVGTAVTQNNVKVPDHQGPGSILRLVSIHVLGILIAKAIPVAHRVIDGKRAHP